MPKLYFMQREFTGQCWQVCDMLEDEDFRKSLIFEDSWYFLHYRFFGRDCVCSETSDAVQTHLYNLIAVLYRDFESLVDVKGPEADRLLSIIAELVDIAEYSEAFPICVWAYGDESTADFLAEWLAPLPSPEQMAHVLKLPHMTQHELERMPYRHSEPKLALKRYRKELADFNKRNKLTAKAEQRSNISK